MKVIKCLFSLALLSTSLYASQAEYELLHTLDTACADSWCEGDDYRFQNVECSEEGNFCDVHIQVPYPEWFDGMDLPTDLEQTQLFVQTKMNKVYSFRCSILGFKNYESISKKKGDLNEDFYEKVNLCITAFANQL